MNSYTKTKKIYAEIDSELFYRFLKVYSGHIDETIERLIALDLDKTPKNKNKKVKKEKSVEPIFKVKHRNVGLDVSKFID